MCFFSFAKMKRIDELFAVDARSLLSNSMLGFVCDEHFRRETRGPQLIDFGVFGLVVDLLALKLSLAFYRILFLVQLFTEYDGRAI